MQLPLTKVQPSKVAQTELLLKLTSSNVANIVSWILVMTLFTMWEAYMTSLH